MPRPLDYNATLASRVDVTDDLAILTVAPDDPPPDAWFVPGQYCLLGMNHDDPAIGPVRRPMTMASAPEHDGPPEFFLNRVATPVSRNPLTHLLWTLAPGDRLFLRAHATGGFTLRDTVGPDDPRHMIFLAEGTGVAPFLCMIRSAALRDPGADLSRMALVHEVASPAELAFDDELRVLAAATGLRYLPTIARAEAAPAWTGDVGAAAEFLAPDRLADTEHRLGLAPGGLTPRSAAIFVCGLRDTIAGCITRALHRGFIPDHRRMRQAFGAPEDARPSLFFEQYDNEPIVNTKDEAAVAPLRAALSAALAR